MAEYWDNIEMAEFLFCISCKSFNIREVRIPDITKMERSIFALRFVSRILALKIYYNRVRQNDIRRWRKFFGVSHFPCAKQLQINL